MNFDMIYIVIVQIKIQSKFRTGDLQDAYIERLDKGEETFSSEVRVEVKTGSTLAYD